MLTQNRSKLLCFVATVSKCHQFLKEFSVSFIKYHKHIIFLIAIFSILTVFYGLYSGLRGEPIVSSKSNEFTGLVCEENIYDFGCLSPANALDMKHQFILKNTSDREIAILKHTSSCGCTVANISSEVILPGQTAKVLLQTNFGEKIGKREVTVILETDDPVTEKLSLKLCALISPSLRFSENPIFFENLKPGEKKTHTVKILKHNKSESIEILKITNTDNDILIHGTNDKDSSIENISIPLDGKQFQVTVIGSEIKGEKTSSIIFHTNSVEQPELKLSVLSQHQGTITAMPSIIIFNNKHGTAEEIKLVQVVSRDSSGKPKFELLSQDHLTPFGIANTSAKIRQGKTEALIAVKCDYKKVESNCHGVLRITINTYVLDIPIVAFVDNN